MNEILYRLRRNEVRAQITREQLKMYWVAEILGIHKTTLRRWFSGRIAHVRGCHLEALAQLLKRHPLQIAEPVVK